MTQTPASRAAAEAYDRWFQDKFNGDFSLTEDEIDELARRFDETARRGFQRAIDWLTAKVQNAKEFDDRYVAIYASQFAAELSDQLKETK